MLLKTDKKGVNDHGALAGLLDATDHPMFTTIDGTRAFTGNQSFGDNNITNVGDIALDSISNDAGSGFIPITSKVQVQNGDSGFAWTPFVWTSLLVESTALSGVNEGAVISLVAEDFTSIYFGDLVSQFSGRIRYNHSDDSMELWTNNAERVHINSIGTGFGTSDLLSFIHIKQGASGVASVVNGTVLTIENNDSSFFNFLTPNTSFAGFLFGDPQNNAAGGLVYSHTADTMTIRVAGNLDKLVIDTDATFPFNTSAFDLGKSDKLWKDLWLSNKALFRDSAIGIYSQADTFLDFFADGATRIGDSSAGAPTNYANFAPDGELTLVGTARVTKHVQFASALGKGASAPDENTGDAPFLSHTYGIGDDSHVSFKIPEDMDVTEDSFVKVRWYTDVAGQTGDEVNWQVQWNSRAVGEAINTGSTTDTSGDVNVPAQWIQAETTVETIPGNSLASEDVIGFDFERIAIVGGTDPDGGSIHVLLIELEYISNKLGLAT